MEKVSEWIILGVVKFCTSSNCWNDWESKQYVYSIWRTHWPVIKIYFDSVYILICKWCSMCDYTDFQHPSMQESFPNNLEKNKLTKPLTIQCLNSHCLLVENFSSFLCCSSKPFRTVMVFLQSILTILQWITVTYIWHPFWIICHWTRQQYEDIRV